MIVARPVHADDGDLDLTFGIRGRVTTDFFASGSAFAIQSDGKIVAAGSTKYYSATWHYSGMRYTENDFVISRFNSDGSPDATFGVGGKVTTDFSGGRDEAWALAIQSDGKIVVAGLASIADMTVTPVPGLAIRGARWVFGLARYNSDGSLDADFGDGGKVTTNFSGNRETAMALAIQSDGRIVAAGQTSLVDGAGPGDPGKFALARYNRDGSLDVTFGIEGKVTTDLGWMMSDWVSALAIGPDNKILAAGAAAVSESKKMNAWLDCFADWIPPDLDFALARYNPDGALDTSFGDGGIVTTDFGDLHDSITSLRLQPDGKIVVSGVAGDDTGTGPCDLDYYYFNSLALARYNSNGSLDTGFGRGGTVTSKFGWADSLAIQSDGRIVAAGSDDNKQGIVPGRTIYTNAAYVEYGNKRSLFRFNPDGSLDPSFGAGGKVTTDFGATGVFIQSDGRIVAAGSDRFGDQNFVLARYGNDSAPTLHPATVRPGDPFTFKFPAAASDTYLDIRFRGPGSTTDQVELNWQRGMSAEHIVPGDMAPGTWMLTGVRTHENPNDHSGDFIDLSLPLVVKVLPRVTGLTFDPGGVHVGSAFTAAFSGAHLTDETWFDLRFRIPGSDTDQVALNWQRGATSGHIAPIGMITGVWTVTGVRAHQDPADYTAEFTPLASTLRVAP